jgi:four helix bundle protein
MANFTELRAWRASVRLAVAVYRATERMPPAERFGLTSQIRRAASSIPANLAEGNGRRSDGDFQRFVSIAAGSVAELESHLLLAGQLGYLAPATVLALRHDVRLVARMLTRLRQALRFTAADPHPRVNARPPSPNSQ